MTYLLNLHDQGRVFLFSLGFGFFIGLFYDIVRLFRLLFSNRKQAFLVFDLLYMLLSAIFTFLFLLTVTEGSVRAYVLFSEALGFFIYVVTIGTAVSTCFDRIVYALRHISKQIFLEFQRCFLSVLNPIRRKWMEKAKKAEKKAGFSAKKSKIHLKSLYDLLYNQHIRKSAYPKIPKWEESEVDQNGKNKKRKKTTSKKA